MTPDDPRSVHSLEYHAAHPLPLLLLQKPSEAEMHRRARVKMAWLCVGLALAALWGWWPVIREFVL